MADKYNPGTVNIEAVTNSILANGGGMSTKTNENGITHVSVYSRSENRHISYDKDKDGNISNVHTDKDNKANMDYKGGR